jgi:hypothetical protein
MASFKEQFLTFYKQQKSIQFSKNIWPDLLAHSLIGLSAGALIVFIRDINPMPVLLLSTTVCGLWGIANRILKD